MGGRSVELEGEGKVTARAWINMRIVWGITFYDLTVTKERWAYAGT